MIDVICRGNTEAWKIMYKTNTKQGVGRRDNTVLRTSLAAVVAWVVLASLVGDTTWEQCVVASDSHDERAESKVLLWSRRPPHVTKNV